MDDLCTVFGCVKDMPGRPFADNNADGHCSVLIKALPGFADLYAGHTTVRLTMLGGHAGAALVALRGRWRCAVRGTGFFFFFWLVVRGPANQNLRVSCRVAHFGVCSGLVMKR